MKRKNGSQDYPQQKMTEENKREGLILMEDNYEEIQNELLAKRKQLMELGFSSLPPKIQGDYSEVLLRDFINKYIDKTVYEVKQGIIYDEKGKKSKECDIIIYRKGKTPLFESGNLVVVNQDDVKFVLEVKSTLNSNKISEAINNLKEVKKLNKNIMCWIVAFETQMLVKTLYRKALQSGTVQFLHVFKSRLSRESKPLIANQMKFFLKAVRQCREYGKYSWTNDFVIYWDGRRRLALTEDKKKNENILSQISSVDFWQSWEKEDIGDYMFEKPHD